MWVSLLGSVLAEVDGVPLRLGGRKQRAVFALLALQPNTPVALDRLVHEVWRDEPPAQSTLSLQSYISRLRRCLADAHGDRAEAPRILTRPPGWVLTMPTDDVDALRFARLAHEGYALVEGAEVSAGATKLREALALWTGDALADLDDMPLALAERTRLDELRLAVTESLMSADLALGRPAEVVESARRFVAENPYREGAWCALTLALYRLGRQAEALEAAQQLRESLAEGLGIDPSPASRLLQEQILRQDPALDHHPRVRQPASELDVPDVVRPEAEVPTDEELVGRTDTTRTLADIAAGAARGHGRFVVVEGPAGMGKSAVLLDLTRRLTATGGLVLRGGGVSAGASPALWPWVSILRQLVETDPDLTEAARAGGSAAALALLDPSVGTSPSPEGQPAEVDAALARTRLYRAVVDLVATTHRRRPLALLLDDAHWLDPDTIDLLALAADELVRRGVVVAVALRADEAPAVATEIASIADRHRTQATRLGLSGLTTSDVAELVRRAAPDAAYDDLAPALVARTGGNPFFLNELVRLLVSERRLNVASVETVLPHEVRDVLRRRLDRLPERTRALLSVVALINRPADVRLLAEVTGVTIEAALDDAEAAVASSLLLEDPTEGALSLSHDLVRQTLVEALSALRRARMHARIAEVMQDREKETSTLPPETVVEIARHLVLAESVVGANAAIPYLVTVADDARSRSGFHLAERALREALDLSGRVADPHRRAALQLELRTRLALQSNVISGAGIFGDEDDIDPGAADVDVETDPMAWWGVEVLHVICGRGPRCKEDALLALARTLPDPVASMVHSVMGLACFVTGELDPADEHLAIAEELGVRASERTPDAEAPWLTSLLVSAPTIRSAAATLAEDHTAAAEHLDRAARRAGTAVPELVLIAYFSAWEAAAEGNPTAALDHARTAVRLGEQLGDTFYVPMSRVILGWATALLGDPSGIDLARSAHAECTAMGLRFQATVRLLLCAEAHAHHGQQEEARALVLDSRSTSRLTQERTTSQRLQRVADGLLTAAG